MFGRLVVNSSAVLVSFVMKAASDEIKHISMNGMPAGHVKPLNCLCHSMHKVVIMVMSDLPCMTIKISTQRSVCQANPAGNAHHSLPFRI
jgi:hypothetical protein